ncbi:MAG: hypothetical protein WDM80_09960 [Limisphaerales bacterium]
MNRRQEQGSALLVVIVTGAIMCVVIASVLKLSSNSIYNTYGRVDWNKAYYNSENAMVWAAQKILDNPPGAGTSNYYSTASGNLPTSALVGPTNGDANFKGAWVSIQQFTNTSGQNYLITSSARVNDKIRTVQASITTYPASTVFDNEYFLDNWGWWWGSSITGNGAQRSNWDFDFQGRPVANGYVYAADLVQQNEVNYNVGQGTPPVSGLAGNDPVTYIHPGAQRVEMPRLLDFSNYIASALSNTSSNGIWIGSTQVVFGVQNNGTKTGIYLVGTAANPIIVKGTAVVPGDVIIKGKVSGKGTLYVGGQLYIAGDLTYANPPDFSTAPETMSATNRDAWVQNNQNADLVAFAVKGSIFGGDVTASDWINYEYNYPGSGLSHVGDESHLGQDGILGTGDDDIPFVHPDGTTSTWYDADGNGQVNGNYNYNNDINMTTARANQILGYPTTGTGNNATPVAYSSFATSNMGSLDGIYYTDHAAAIRMQQGGAVYHGSIISRNEQIVFTSSLVFTYDSRIHSRYRNNPNQYVNLGLPYGKIIQVNSLVELTPDTSNL